MIIIRIAKFSNLFKPKFPSVCDNYSEQELVPWFANDHGKQFGTVYRRHIYIVISPKPLKLSLRNLINLVAEKMESGPEENLSLERVIG